MVAHKADTKIANGGLQSNKCSVHFFRFVAEFWLCNMLRKRFAKIENDFWCYCAVAHLRGNNTHHCPFHWFHCDCFCSDIEGVQNKVICL